MTREDYWDRVEATRREMAQRKDSAKVERERKYTLARIPRGYWEVDFSVIPDKFDYKRQVQSWLSKFIDKVRRGEAFPGMYLHGPLGSGKTAIAAGLMTHLVTKGGIPGLWVDYSDIVDIASKDPVTVDGTNEGLWTYANHARIVVLDDLLRGGVSNPYSALQIRRVEELLRNRWTQGLATIVTGNASLADLEGVDSLASVIEESCYNIEVSGANFRAWKAKHKEPL